MKLQQTQDYLLFINEKAEIKENTWYENNGVLFLSDSKYDEGNNPNNSNPRVTKYNNSVIAYRKLNENAKELNLPELPPFEEVDIKELAEEEYESKGWNEPWKSRILEKQEAFIKGYKAAQSKQFSLEDVKKALHFGEALSRYFGTHKAKERESFIQSLSTQQLPKEFIPEYNLMNKGYDKPEDYPYQECKVLKTITNSEGKQELIGVYKY